MRFEHTKQSAWDFYCNKLNNEIRLHYLWNANVSSSYIANHEMGASVVYTTSNRCSDRVGKLSKSKQIAWVQFEVHLQLYKQNIPSSHTPYHVIWVSKTKTGLDSGFRNGGEGGLKATPIATPIATLITTPISTPRLWSSNFQLHHCTYKYILKQLS